MYIESAALTSMLKNTLPAGALLETRILIGVVRQYSRFEYTGRIQAGYNCYMILATVVL